MTKLCIFLLFFTLINVDSHTTMNEQNNISNNLIRFGGNKVREPVRRGWQKQPPCGRHGHPCPIPTIPIPTTVMDFTTSNPPIIVTSKLPFTETNIPIETTKVQPIDIPLSTAVIDITTANAPIIITTKQTNTETNIPLETTKVQPMDIPLSTAVIDVTTANPPIIITTKQPTTETYLPLETTKVQPMDIPLSTAVIDITTANPPIIITTKQPATETYLPLETTKVQPLSAAVIEITTANPPIIITTKQLNTETYIPVETTKVQSMAILPSTAVIEITTANPQIIITTKQLNTETYIPLETTKVQPMPITRETATPPMTSVEKENDRDDSQILWETTTPALPSITPNTGEIVFLDDDDVDKRTTSGFAIQPISRPTEPPREKIEGKEEPKVNANTTPSAEVAACMRNCSVSAEYNPICGSNGVTYSNPGRLLCAQNCGDRVSGIYRGFCQVRIVVTTQSPAMRSCINSCPVMPGFYPICGTDGVTYYNAGHLLCAQSCGVNVRLLSHNPCPTTATTSPPASTIYPPITTNNPIDSRTTSSVALRDCMLRCSATRELDPVCGSDGNTYVNPAYLRCAQICGVEVAIMADGWCPESTTVPTSSTPNPVDVTTQSIKFRNCIERCPSTPEFSPVCGSDYITYENSGKLRCARICGLGVTELRQGPCNPGRRNRNKTTPPRPN